MPSCCGDWFGDHEADRLRLTAKPLLNWGGFSYYRETVNQVECTTDCFIYGAIDATLW
jgi:hypothetical protein